MAQFVFKLEGVLRQRKQVEHDRQRILAEKQRALVQVQALLLDLQQTVNATNEDVRKNHLVGRLNMEFIAAHRRFLAGMQRQSIATMQRMALAQRAVDEARLELAEAAKRRKAIEKLRESQLQDWRSALARREQAEMDEIGMQLAYENLAAEESAAATMEPPA